MPARISTADSMHLVDQLAKLAKQHGGVAQATERLNALKAVAHPDTVKVIDQIVTSHEGTAAHRIQAAKDELARALRYTHTADWSQIGGGIPQARGVHVTELRKSALSDAVFMEGKLGKDDEGYM